MRGTRIGSPLEWWPGGPSPRMRGTPRKASGDRRSERSIPAHAGNTATPSARCATRSVHPRACGEHIGGLSRIEHQVRSIPAHAGNTHFGFLSVSVLAVHPRACGEHPLISIPPSFAGGPSPRMRGTHGNGPRITRSARSIPAHAGNTQLFRNLVRHVAVHPRACGEHGRGLAAVIALFGPSPRMRGTRQADDPVRPVLRSIPAHAGNTPGSGGPVRPWPVHPRACGEHGRGLAAVIALFGPSPRMRGTRQADDPVRPVLRSIPAHAGNTPGSGGPVRPWPVHPRACGEHLRASSQAQRAAGPSPRMRGTLLRGQPTLRQHRSIPAHAGNTAWTWIKPPWPAVHPRACGEHRFCLMYAGLMVGPSPRMRGTQVVSGAACLASRSIPAHAGNTATHAGGSWPWSVHPRACGEHLPMAAVELGEVGPSPRMRGTLFLGVGLRGGGRSIPAHAGNTAPGLG